MKLRELKEMPPLLLEDLLVAEVCDDQAAPVSTEGQTTLATDIQDLDRLVGMRDPILLRPKEKKEQP